MRQMQGVSVTVMVALLAIGCWKTQAPSDSDGSGSPDASSESDGPEYSGSPSDSEVSGKPETTTDTKGGEQPVDPSDRGETASPEASTDNLLENCTTLSLSVSERAMSSFDGVDLLLVVDSSSSMAEEQASLTAAFYTLVQSLVRPMDLGMDSTGGWMPVDNLRVAVVSSDMGLQWGEAFNDSGEKVGGNSGGNTLDIPGCENDYGQNGAFLSVNVTSVDFPGGLLPCVEGGEACPPGFICEDDGCEPSGETGTVSCPDDTPAFLEKTGVSQNQDIALHAACLVQQGTEGCGVGQPLEAAMRGLETHAAADEATGFLVRSHVLAVLVVSDEEDCSIRDSGLFTTDEWVSESEVQTSVACSYPAHNETFLFPADADDARKISETHNIGQEDLLSYYDRLVAMKDGRVAEVSFGAIVGVPGLDDDTCQGDGVTIGDNGCLDHPKMALRIDTFTDPESNREHTHFAPACERLDPSGAAVTQARPGRRFVKVAQEFGRNGIVSSICNDDWSPAMEDYARIVTRQLGPSCFPSRLDWEPAPSAGCPDCGHTSCELMIDYQRVGADLNDISCPEALYAGLEPSEADRYVGKKSIQAVKADDGTTISNIVSCPLPKLATPLRCDAAKSMVDQRQPGWYYCEQHGESFEDACTDGLDNDDDDDDGVFNGPGDRVDCDDSDCADCVSCGGTGRRCGQGCRFFVALTAAFAPEANRQFLKIRCVASGELAEDQCGLSEDVPFGARCLQPRFQEEEPERFFHRNAGLAEISFQKGCDCLTYVQPFSENLQVDINHFCTRPCIDDCPSGFRCEALLSVSDEIPPGVSPSYCVPDCIAEGCPQVRVVNGVQQRQVCAPSVEGGVEWECRWK